MIRLHCNSSLPRAGSELLQALLAQHPQVYASATSPLLEYWYGAMANFTLPEVKAQEPSGMRSAFIGMCRSGADGYYRALTDKPVVVDKSRGWLEYADFLWEVIPDARIVCMVRDVDAIISSLERAYQRNPMHPEARSLPRSEDSRRRAWLSPESAPLGIALTRLQARKRRGPDSRIRYVDYEELVQEPVQVMRRVFEFLRLDDFSINPGKVEKSVPETPGVFGIFGDHSVRSTVGPGDVVT